MVLLANTTGVQENHSRNIYRHDGRILHTLVDGLIGTEILLKDSDFHPILTSTIIAFGFVFIHPFVDGNGRIHRYLIHDTLAKLKVHPSRDNIPGVGRHIRTN